MGFSSISLQTRTKNLPTLCHRWVPVSLVIVHCIAGHNLWERLNLWVHVNTMYKHKQVGQSLEWADIDIQWGRQYVNWSVYTSLRCSAASGRALAIFLSDDDSLRGKIVSLSNIIGPCIEWGIFYCKQFQVRIVYLTRTLNILCVHICFYLHLGFVYNSVLTGFYFLLSCHNGRFIVYWW